MDSLKIQDVFEPYYAGRKRFAARRDKTLPSDANDRQSQKPAPRDPKADIRIAETESTTEH